MKLSTSMILVLIAFIGQGCASQQSTYSSPDAAVNSLVSAVRAHDRDQLKHILGPDSDEVLSSGDAVADRQSGERFLTAYDAKHALVTNDDGSVTLNVGDQDWPLPIPVVKDPKNGKWSFDTEAGKEEIINRRIGRNELDVIQVCQAIVDAQREYVQRDPNGDGIPEYATKFISDPGTKDGLYWPTSDGEPESPLGPRIAEATEQGYKLGTGEPQPYHGYYYRILTAQGPNATGGAIDYMVKGKLIGGFAVIAWPAQYGNSGIMSFIVNHHEIVYQKDLGPDTDKLARAITTFDPGPDWKKAQ